jgi:hypothetical protein
MVPTLQQSRQVGKHMKQRRAEKKKAQDFLVSEKNTQINKDNQILLSKLVEIQTGKYCSLPRPKSTVSPAAASTLVQSILKIGSKKALLQELRKSDVDQLKRN